MSLKISPVKIIFWESYFHSVVGTNDALHYDNNPTLSYTVDFEFWFHMGHLKAQPNLHWISVMLYVQYMDSARIAVRSFYSLTVWYDNTMTGIFLNYINEITDIHLSYNCVIDDTAFWCVDLEPYFFQFICFT